MSRDERLERAASAYREHRRDGSIADSPDWHDLDAADRVSLHARTAALRALEAALDASQLSTTARAVLARITRDE
jgi:hypothetical protein